MTPRGPTEGAFKSSAVPRSLLSQNAGGNIYQEQGQAPGCASWTEGFCCCCREVLPNLPKLVLSGVRWDSGAWAGRRSCSAHAPRGSYLPRELAPSPMVPSPGSGWTVNAQCVGVQRRCPRRCSPRSNQNLLWMQKAGSGVLRNRNDQGTLSCPFLLVLLQLISQTHCKG